MITSSSIQYISQVLAEPKNISDADKESIDALTEAYPYFVPARYLSAANLHKKAPFSNDMMSAMQLYTGNWLLYNQFLQSALPEEKTQPQETPVINDTAAEIETLPEGINLEPIIEEPVLQHKEEENIITGNTAETQTDTTGFVFGQPVEPAKETEPLFTQKAKYEEDETDESFILPVYTEDYFLHQGMQVSNKIPEDLPRKEPSQAEEAKSLMVMMSFAEWLTHFKSRKEKEAEEAQGQKAVKTMWQKEKLAAALEEENEEIPEKVFEMAVNSITNEDDLVSESLAEVHLMQGRHDKAIEMYRKLSLRNPQKKAYFARKIEVILKDKQS